MALTADLVALVKFFCFMYMYILIHIYVCTCEGNSSIFIHGYIHIYIDLYIQAMALTADLGASVKTIIVY